MFSKFGVTLVLYNIWLFLLICNASAAMKLNPYTASMHAYLVMPINV